MEPNTQPTQPVTPPNPAPVTPPTQPVQAPQPTQVASAAQPVQPPVAPVTEQPQVAETPPAGKPKKKGGNRLVIGIILVVAGALVIGAGVLLLTDAGKALLGLTPTSQQQVLDTENEATLPVDPNAAEGEEVAEPTDENLDGLINELDDILALPDVLEDFEDFDPAKELGL